MEVVNRNIKMNTPIAEFVGKYCENGTSRFHMPGHKGVNRLGFEQLDITEIGGADDLADPEGIIAESEANATMLFGSGRTVYSTEGSSHTVKAMLKLALDCYKGKERPFILAARNVHKAFIYGCALLNLDVKWIMPSLRPDALLCGSVMPSELDAALKNCDYKPVAVYVTSPDYLGNMCDIKGLSEVCAREGILLLVDNAHGSYLHFLSEPSHPMDLGADMCCDSAHKTLPVITGGAYLHVSKKAPLTIKDSMKEALSLFGTSSPSYLILQSLDICNRILSEEYPVKLNDCINRINDIKEKYAKVVMQDTDPLRIVVKGGRRSAELLRSLNSEYEYADDEYVVLMLTPDNSDKDFEILEDFLQLVQKLNVCEPEELVELPAIVQKMSIREAVMAPYETVSADDSLGRILATPSVMCPPAVPIAISGALISEAEVNLFKKYGVKSVKVVL